MKCINKDEVIEFIEKNVNKECWSCNIAKELQNGDIICGLFAKEIDYCKDGYRLERCKQLFEDENADK